MDNAKVIECPDEESLLLLAEGKLDKLKREALLKHIAECKTCSVEFYYLRSSKQTEAPVKRVSAKKKNTYRLVTLAAMIALIFGFTGIYNVINRQAGVNMKDIVSESIITYDSETPKTEAPAPIAAIRNRTQNIAIEANEQNLPEYSTQMNDMARGTAASNVQVAPEAQVTQKMERTANFELSGTTVYEVVYNGHEGDISEIIDLIQLITETDEENARIMAESSAIVIKKCSSLEEAQRIKNEMELAGAKIEIK